MNLKKIFYWVCALAVLAGVFLRFFHLRESGFFFYDEAFYLRHNLPILEFIQKNLPQTLNDRWIALQLYLRSALGSGKSLWFLVMDSRFFFGGLHDWMLPKVIAACFGVLSLPLAYMFARRYYADKAVALLAVALMAIMPSMVFYSRIGLQEALSVCLVLSGMYLYLFNRGLNLRTLLAGIVLAAAFFSNYRLIVLPALVFCAEAWEGVALKKGFDLRKYVWSTVAFMACVVVVGNLLDGANTRVIFAWVFHQEDIAGASFSWINLLSYPFYLLLLDTALFAGAFFAGIWFFAKRGREKALPFVLVLAQMVIFSLPSEKGARYLCVMLPFAVMSVSFMLISIYQSLPREIHRRCVLGFAALMSLLMVVKSVELMLARSDYEPALAMVDKHVPGAKILSTQDQVHGLYAAPSSRVKPVPMSFERLLPLYNDGYRYLIVDPQVYVGMSAGVRFKPELRDYMSFVDKQLKPVAEFDHMNHAMLERFVCEHSENLGQSIRFLYSRDIKRMSSIRIYDLNGVVPRMAEIYNRMLKERKR